jgi:hypothetical protein
LCPFFVIHLIVAQGMNCSVLPASILMPIFETSVISAFSIDGSSPKKAMIHFQSLIFGVSDMLEHRPSLEFVGNIRHKEIITC